MSAAPVPAPAPDLRTDPWAHAAAPWIPFAGDRRARAEQRHFTKPALWQRLPDAADRALVAACARQVVAAEPAIGFAFSTLMLEQLRARGEAARTAEERERLHQLEVVLSRHVAELPDLRERVRALPTEARA
jgi:hypothetical protein